jgi:hypothetical protein
MKEATPVWPAPPSPFAGSDWFDPLEARHGKRFRYALAEGERIMSDRAIYRRRGSHAAALAAGAELVRLPARIAWECRCGPAGGGKVL